MVAAFGAAVVLCGIGCMVMQLYVSIRDRAKTREPHRRSVRRPYPGMVHLLAAATVQFRGDPDSE
jgi:hypothetical protein